MEEINFDECSAAEILAYLEVLHDAIMKLENCQYRYDRVCEKCFELKHKLICLERKNTSSEKAELKLEKLKSQYADELDKKYFAEIDLNNGRGRISYLKERYKKLIDEKYWLDGTLNDVFGLIALGKAQTVNQALQLLKKI